MEREEAMKRLLLKILLLVKFILELMVPIIIVYFFAGIKIIYIDVFFYKFLGLSYIEVIILEVSLLILILYIYRYGIDFIKFDDFIKKFPGKTRFSHIQYEFRHFPKFLKKYAFFNVILFMNGRSLEEIVSVIVTWLNETFKVKIDLDSLNNFLVNGFLNDHINAAIRNILILKYFDPQLLQVNINIWYAFVFLVVTFAYKNKIDFDVAEIKSEDNSKHSSYKIKTKIKIKMLESVQMKD